MTYTDLKKNTITKRIYSLLDKGILYRRKDGKFKYRRTDQMAFNTPWIHIKSTLNRKCDLWTLYVNHFNVIPEGCLNCWKIVARPKNFDEAVRFKNLMVGWNFPSKIGCEPRKFVPAHWGAYFYNDDMMEAITKFQIIRKGMDEIDPNNSVILKKGCSEFEQKYGDSRMWKGNPEFEKRLNDYFAWDFKVLHQPDEAIESVMMDWYEFAHSVGDMSYLPHNNGELLFPKPYVYYDGKPVPAPNPIPEPKKKVKKNVRSKKSS